MGSAQHWGRIQDQKFLHGPLQPNLGPGTYVSVSIARAPFFESAVIALTRITTAFKTNPVSLCDSGIDVFDFVVLIGLVLRLLVVELVLDLEILRLRREGIMWTILNRWLLLLGGSCQGLVGCEQGGGLYGMVALHTGLSDVGESASPNLLGLSLSQKGP